MDEGSIPNGRKHTYDHPYTNRQHEMQPSVFRNYERVGECNHVEERNHLLYTFKDHVEQRAPDGVVKVKLKYYYRYQHVDAHDLAIAFLPKEMHVGID